MRRGVREWMELIYATPALTAKERDALWAKGVAKAPSSGTCSASHGAGVSEALLRDLETPLRPPPAWPPDTAAAPLAARETENTIPH
jgi:hypothetical protein